MTTVSWNDTIPYWVTQNDIHLTKEDETGSYYDTTGDDWGDIIDKRQGPELEIRPINKKDATKFVDEVHRELDGTYMWKWGISVWAKSGHKTTYTPNPRKELDLEDRFIELDISKDKWSEFKFIHQYGPRSTFGGSWRNRSYPTNDPCFQDKFMLFALTEKFKKGTFNDIPLCCGSVSRQSYEEQLVGVATVEVPTAPKDNAWWRCEITRCAVKTMIEDGTGPGWPNACSKLYSTCTKIAKAMGYKQLITFTRREDEKGDSIKASGAWREILLPKPSATKKRRKTDTKYSNVWRTRWELDI